MRVQKSQRKEWDLHLLKWNCGLCKARLTLKIHKFLSRHKMYHFAMQYSRHKPEYLSCDFFTRLYVRLIKRFFMFFKTIKSKAFNLCKIKSEECCVDYDINFLKLHKCTVFEWKRHFHETIIREDRVFCLFVCGLFFFFWGGECWWVLKMSSLYVIHV